MFEKQDPAHLKAMEEMQAWFEGKQKEFEALPEK